MKRLLILVAVTVLIATGCSVQTAKAAGNPYPDGQCTYYVWQRVKEVLGIELPTWGNAGTWDDSARGIYTVDSTPAAGAILVEEATSSMPNGHVAFIERIEGENAYFSDNYGSDYFNIYTWNNNRTHAVIGPNGRSIIHLTGATTPEPGIPIDAEHFPDNHFREYVRQYDKDHNEKLSDEERNRVSQLCCSKLNISDMKGIEYFTEATELFCDGNQLTSLDVSKNTKLFYVDCQDNQLKSLDVSKLSELNTLYCYRNRISTLNVGNCPILATVVGTQERRRYSGDDYDYFLDIVNKWCLSVDPWVKVTAGSVVSMPTADNPYAAPPNVGDSFTDQERNYQITGSNDVMFTGLQNAGSSTRVSIPATVDYEGQSFKVTEIAAKALYKNAQVTELEIGKNVKTIGKSAFEGCGKLKTVKGAKGVITIRDAAFSGCKALKTVPGFDKLQTIGANAFKGCIKMAKFTLGKAVKSIGKNAFNGCKALKTITVKTGKLTMKNVGAGAFKGIYKKAMFSCPKNKVKEYKKIFVKKGAPKGCRFK